MLELESEGDAPAFCPGAGARPRHLAGREKEKEVLAAFVGCLKSKRSPPAECALHGPRGVGKTVMLRWLERVAAEEGIDVVGVSANEIESKQSLFEATLGEPAPEVSSETAGTEAHGEVKAGAGISGVVKAGGGGGFSRTKSKESRYGEMSVLGWRKMLAEKCEKKPMLVLVDEAHTLNLEVAKHLLNASKNLRGKVDPPAAFGVVLAGTPGLQVRMSKAHTTFWSRLDDGNLKLGLLSMKESMEALSKPLAERFPNAKIKGGAIRMMAEMSDGFPYFVQVWGRRMEKRIAENPERAESFGLLDVAAVKPEVQKIREDIYKERQAEARKARVLPAMKELAPCLSEWGSCIDLDEAESLVAAISGKEGDAAVQEASKAIDKMLEIGVVQQDGENLQSAMPSFFEFLAPARNNASHADGA